MIMDKVFKSLQDFFVKVLRHIKTLINYTV